MAELHRGPGLRGRRREGAALDMLLEAVRAGHGRALVVRGEAGILTAATMLEYLLDVGVEQPCRHSSTTPPIVPFVARGLAPAGARSVERPVYTAASAGGERSGDLFGFGRPHPIGAHAPCGFGAHQGRKSRLDNGLVRHDRRHPSSAKRRRLARACPFLARALFRTAPRGH
jgi:hypothetical protein